jgi:hypothetical protein
MRSSSALVLFVVCAAGCASVDAPPLATATFDTLPGGIVSVTNAAPTAWADDSSGWKFVETLRVSPDSGPGQLNIPGQVVVDGAGRLYVQDHNPASIKVFEPDGRFVRTIGRDGEGPGEFRAPMIGIHGPHLIVHDPQLSRLSIFDTSGAFLRSWKSACCHWRAIDVDTTGRITVAIPSESRPEYASGYARFSVDGATLDTIWVPRGGETRLWTITSDNGRGRMSRNVPGSPGDLQGFGPGGQLFHGWTADYRIIESRGTSDTVRIFGRTVAPLEVPEARRREVFERAVAQTAKNYGEATVRRAFRFDDIPSSAPPINGMWVDPTGTRWVSVPSADTTLRLLDVFDDSGVYLGQLRKPGGSAQRISWIGAKELVTVGETEEGVPEVVVYRIDRTVPDR